MRRAFFMLLSCVMAFTLVITVSASSSRSSSGVKKEFFIDLTSQPKDIKKNDINNIDNKMDEKTVQKETVEITSREGIDTYEDKDKDIDIDKDKVKDKGIETDIESNTNLGSNTTNADADANTDINANANKIGENVDSVPAKTTEASDELEKLPEDKPVLPESVNVKFDLASPGIYGSLFLVNKVNTLGNKFIPQGLVPVSSQSTGLVIASSKANTMLGKDALISLNSMYNAASGSGIKDMVLSSGYRDYYKQNSLFNRKVNSFIRKLGRKAAEDKASTVVAPPGSSEHQTGFAVDITTRQLLKRSDPLIAEFADTACGKWMSAHSWEFGYVLRYQSNKMHITGIVYEPWHFRYVGKPHAEIMYKNGFCLEEYVKFMKNKSRVCFTDVSGTEFEISYVCPPAGTGILSIAADKGSVVEVSKVDIYGYAITVKKSKTETNK